MAAIMLVGCANGTAPGSTTSKEEGDGKMTTQDRLNQIAKLGSSPDDNYRVWYEIFVYSYCDSNGDGIGDLNGVRSKLSELTALGINGIWLMPIHPSTSYHKYNVSDYYEIDPAYGTLGDFQAFMADCKALGIDVILDLVVNHTGSDHPWFKEAVAYLRTLPAGAQPDPAVCKYVDYYNFIPASQVESKAYNKIAGTEYAYECQFSHDMPDLNLDSQAVRDEIRSIMQYWIDKGVAGFRVDAAKEFFTGNTTKNVEVMHFLQETVESIKPDAYMVAEVWDSFATITSYYKSGFTSIFNYPFGNSNGKIVKVLRDSGNPATVKSYAEALQKANEAYSGNHPEYIDAPFLSNHDVGRIAGFVGRDEARTKLAGAMNILMSGSVFIYYGEEIGMIAGGTNDPSKRAPMVWYANGGGGTTNPPPECTLPAEYIFGSLDEQRSDDSSIYNYYRQAIAIRKALPVISHGDITVEEALNMGCVSAQRKTWGDKSCIILMNISTEANQADLSAYGDWTLAATLLVDEAEVTLSGNTLDMPGYSVAILIPNS